MNKSRVIHRAVVPMAYSFVLFWAGGCSRGISYEEYDAITAWLTCDDCLDGERERVAAIGDRAIPFLEEALDSLPGNRRDNMRAQYWELHQFMGSTGDSTTFVDGYLQSMETAVRMRSATSLGDLGAESVLADALSGQLPGWRPEALEALQMALLRADLPPVGTGATDAWAVVGPAAAVNLCNGMGSTACTLPDVPRVDVVAQVTGPTSWTQPPWTVGTVHFLYRTAGSSDPPREAGRVDLGSAVQTDNGTNIFYRWTLPFFVHDFPGGPIEVFAVAAPMGDEPIRSTSNDSITIVEGF